MAAGFFIGAVSPATIVARVRQADLTQGSGNPGATNTGRLLGLRWGVVVGVVDVLKGLVPTLVALCGWDGPTAYAVGLACVLGHVLSPYLRGRGGKGVATSLGAILAVFPAFARGAGGAVRADRVADPLGRGGVALGGGGAGAVGAFGPLPEPVLLGRLWGLAVALLIVARHEPNIRAVAAPAPRLSRFSTRGAAFVPAVHSPSPAASAMRRASLACPYVAPSHRSAATGPSRCPAGRGGPRRRRSAPTRSGRGMDPAPAQADPVAGWVPARADVELAAPPRRPRAAQARRQGGPRRLGRIGLGPVGWAA